MNARYYVPSIGRFASADTIVPDPTNPQQFNRYAYVLNNPLRFTDPTGHLSEDEIHDYFGYDSNEALAAWGEELFKLLWDTELTWGDVFDYDGNDAMLVLFEVYEAGSSIYRGGFWGLDGAYYGKEVPEYKLRNSDDVDYNPWRTNAYKDLGYRTLPRQTGSDGYNNYDPVLYSDILTIGHTGAAVGTIGFGATVVVGFACTSNPVGWVVCMGGGAGMVAMGATVGGFGITLISPPDSIDYPLLRLPVVGGNAPQLYGLGSPSGLFE